MACGFVDDHFGAGFVGSSLPPLSIPCRMPGLVSWASYSEFDLPSLWYFDAEFFCLDFFSRLRGMFDLREKLLSFEASTAGEGI